MTWLAIAACLLSTALLPNFVNAQFVWKATNYTTLAAAEAAMRNNPQNVYARFLEYRSTETLNNRPVRKYEVKPRSGPIATQAYMAGGLAERSIGDNFCGLMSTLDQALACMNRVFPGGYCQYYYGSSGTADSGTTYFATNEWTTYSGFICSVPDGSDAVYAEEDTFVDCYNNSDPLYRRPTSVCSSGWYNDCASGTPRAQKTAMCYPQAQPSLVNGLMDEIIGAEYQLSIEPIAQQTPSPKGSSDNDRAITLNVRLERPGIGTAETQPVTFDLKVEATSGGMVEAAAIGGGTRPRGWLLPNACSQRQQRPNKITTGANVGESGDKDRAQLKLQMQFLPTEQVAIKQACYVVSEYSGSYTLEGKCDGLPNCVKTEARREFDIRVDNALSNLRDNINLIGNVSFVGQTNFAPSNHWLAQANNARLEALVSCWNAARRPRPNRPGQFLDPLLSVNDASLEWGGKFSVNGSWRPTAHVSHRLGSSLDIRADGDAPRLGSVTIGKRLVFQECARGAGIGFQLELPPTVRAGAEHYHLNF